MSFASTLASDTGLNPNLGELTYLTRNDPTVLIRKCTFVGENCINDFEPVSTVGGVTHLMDHLLS